MHRALTDEVFDHLQGPPLARLGRTLGLSHDETGQAIVAALPLIVGGLACRANSPANASSLFAALDPSADVDADALGGVERIFGMQTPAVVSGLGQATGLGTDRARMLLEQLLPSVHGRVTRRLAGGDGLTDLLRHERERIEQRGGVGSRLLARLVECEPAADVDLADLHHLAPSYPGGAVRPVLH